jgi:hypothetical protein
VAQRYCHVDDTLVTNIFAFPGKGNPKLPKLALDE